MNPNFPRQHPVMLAVLGAIASCSASAQTQPVQERLDTVIVSAQKKAQSIQDVPGAVASVGADTLEANKIDSIYNLTALVPALQITAVDPPGQGTGIALRGLGNSVFNMGFDPAVSTFVDGISRSRSGLVAASDFLDVERIEVLKGPQGTLFGKNTTAGLVHVISTKPRLGGRDSSFSVGYESYGTLRAKAATNIPVNSELAFRVAANTAKGDGWMEVAPTGEKIHGLDRSALKAQMLWKPNANFSAHVIVDFAKLDEVCCVPMRLVNDPRTATVNGPLAAAVGSTIVNPPNLAALKVESNLPPVFKARDQGASAELVWDMKQGMSLTSQTGYRHYTDNNVKDNDFSGVDILRSNDSLPKVDLLSQELRLAGTSADKRTEWLVGAYGSKETIERESDFIWGSQVSSLVPFINVGTAFEHRFRQEITSAALFGSMTHKLDEQWKLTAGLRWSRDKKHGTLVSNYPLTNQLGLPNSLPLAVVYDYDQSVDQSAPTGNLSVQYQVSRNVMAYGTVSRGYKSGGLSMTRDAAGQKMFFGPRGAPCPAGSTPTVPGICAGQPQSAAFDKETADHVEMGIKTDLMDRSVRLNAAVWNTQFKGLQMQTLRSDGSFAVINAKGATSQGLEADLTATVADGLTLTASVQYADAHFADGIPALSSGPGYIPLGGAQLPFSSRLITGLGFNYMKPLGGKLNFFTNGNANYRSKYYNSSEPNTLRVQSGYAVLSLRAGVGTDKWDVALWCRNCTNQRVTNSNFSLPFDGAILGAASQFTHVSEPRFVGVNLNYYFN